MFRSRTTEEGHLAWGFWLIKVRHFCQRHLGQENLGQGRVFRGKWGSCILTRAFINSYIKIRYLVEAILQYVCFQRLGLLGQGQFAHGHFGFLPGIFDQGQRIIDHLV